MPLFNQYDNHVLFLKVYNSIFRSIVEQVYILPIQKQWEKILYITVHAMPFLATYKLALGTQQN